MMAMLMGLRTISPQALDALRRDGRVDVYDVNPRGRWLEARVPGARTLDHERMQASDLPADRTRPLVFYCSNPLCRKAPIAAKRALALGYADVRVMAAGISGWRAAGLPVESGE
ncbi:MAG: rhodanese-like domain-containing protein [Candidatus Eisenbacteria bacterium]